MSELDSKTSEHCVLVLQGGGALGAYQAGVYDVLCQSYREPSWVAGISIGAINAALIAGNAPKSRMDRLSEFWHLVSATSWFDGLAGNESTREYFNTMSAAQVMAFGVPGFFTPRIPAAPFHFAGADPAISFYDTSALRTTLERLIDFDRLNSGAIRLSVGAVNVRTGNFAYFDTANGRIDARHIMASGALPPGFAPVEIDGEHYWDGGLVSNTPLQYVLDQPDSAKRVIFQVDLFSARGAMPASIPDVLEREKEIRFSSRTRLNTTHELQRRHLLQSIQRLIAKLPAELRDDADARALSRTPCEEALDIVHLIYRSKHYETQSMDYEFSRRSMLEHWEAGRTDMSRTLADPRWQSRPPMSCGVRVFDLSRKAEGHKPATSVSRPSHPQP